MDDVNPRLCMHKMAFAEKFCVCERCGQTWQLKTTKKRKGEGTWTRWEPADPDYEYRGSPKESWRRKKR